MKISPNEMKKLRSQEWNELSDILSNQLNIQLDMVVFFPPHDCDLLGVAAEFWGVGNIFDDILGHKLEDMRKQTKTKNHE